MIATQAQPLLRHDESWRAARSQEAAYLAGVRANIEQYGPMLVGTPRATVRTAAGDERKLVRDRALSAGADPDAVAGLPVNGELWAPVRRGRKTVLHVLVRSFAAWQSLRRAGYVLPGCINEEVRAYLESRLRYTGDTPCLFALFAPGGWPPSVQQSAHAGERARVLLCRADGGRWCEILGEDYGWHTWLCLTPMSLERRAAWCAARLDGDRAMRIDGIVGADDAVERLGLPSAVGERLVEETCSGPDARYRLGRTSDGRRFVQRKVR